jgi:hypothetical protein
VSTADKSHNPRKHKTVPMYLPYVPIEMEPEEYGISNEKFAERLRQMEPLVASGALKGEAFDLATLTEEEFEEYCEAQIMDGVFAEDVPYDDLYDAEPAIHGQVGTSVDTSEAVAREWSKATVWHGRHRGHPRRTGMQYR